MIEVVVDYSLLVIWWIDLLNGVLNQIKIIDYDSC